MVDRRVVITGLGVVTPIGVGKGPFWKALIAGENGVAPITSFDTSPYPSCCGAEVRDFDPYEYLSPEAVSRMGRVSQFAVACARMAVEDAGLAGHLDPEMVGVAMGTNYGEIGVVETMSDTWVQRGYEQIDPQLISSYPMHLISANVATEFGVEGPVFMISNACSAGNWAIGYASDLIKSGTVDVMLAGASDSMSRIAFIGFSRSFAMAPEICQPFDKNRKGLIVSEGAAFLILESFEHARRRRAEIYAEVAGYGVACDAYHITGPHPEGKAAIAATENALRASGLALDDIDYISAHGTGTKPNDRVETLAIKKVFGERAKRIPVSSIKSMIGHSFGAASAIEAAVCALCIRHAVIPATINYFEPDPECDLDYVPNEARDHKVRALLNNSYAFGGNCAVLALRALR